MKHVFEAAAKAALESGASVGEFRELVGAAVTNGLSREDAQRTLERLRADAPTEEYEDRALEFLDVVTGFCAPHIRVPWQAEKNDPEKRDPNQE